MYLPQWMVAALAAFRAANQPDSMSSSLGFSEPMTELYFEFHVLKEGNYQRSLGVDSAKVGSVVKLYVFRLLVIFTQTYSTCLVYSRR